MVLLTQWCWRCSEPRLTREDSKTLPERALAAVI